MSVFIPSGLLVLLRKLSVPPGPTSAPERPQCILRLGSGSLNHPQILHRRMTKGPGLTQPLVYSVDFSNFQKRTRGKHSLTPALLFRHQAGAIAHSREQFLNSGHLLRTSLVYRDSVSLHTEMGQVFLEKNNCECGLGQNVCSLR